MAECTGRHCNQDPIKTCTSLPKVAPGAAPANFDQACRDLAQMMCLSVVRSMEEYNRKHRTNANAKIPTALQDWVNWAKSTQQAQPGLPDCLDRTTKPMPQKLGEAMVVDKATLPADKPEQAKSAEYLGRVYRGVMGFGSQLIGFDVDDWNDG
jgi:hypothetical protein